MLMHRRSFAALMVVALLPLLAGCGQRADSDRGATASAGMLADQTPLAVPAGVQLAVRLSTPLSSGTARVGDPWSGTVVTAVTIGDQEAIPANCRVQGVVTGAQPAGRGTRAMLDLAIREVTLEAAPRPLAAGIEAILAELPEAPGTGVPRGDIAPVEKGSEVVLEPGVELVFSVDHPIR
jgi:hypothetical protein